ncbi:hypothetical protein B0A68_05555 [Flavobacterium reichenbachii]|uniref:Lipocalin-like domain-containing protein n=2 Tax=Flavobacterium reichenbachii TaxID=362418 RepID=A0A085ZEP2_9FLAO|nr:hypothetical protein IW19_22370 [Flavobacterium reichenbachii]OXB16897.1 hypothetical protein B0A68_05555 [Flavobacterium reichenbachii]
MTMLFTCFWSCSNDSEIIPDDTSGDIQGAWILKAEYTGGIRQPLSECRLYETISFSGTEILLVRTDESETKTCSLTTYEGIFARTGTSLSVTLPSENFKVKIKELTAVKLVLIAENSGKMTEYERAKPYSLLH